MPNRERPQNWIRFALLAVMIANIAALLVVRDALLDGRERGRGNRQVNCALLRDHTDPNAGLYSVHSVEVYNRRCADADQ